MNRKKDSMPFQERTCLDNEKGLIELEKECAELRNLVEDLYEIILRSGMVKGKGGKSFKPSRRQSFLIS